MRCHEGLVVEPLDPEVFALGAPLGFGAARTTVLALATPARAIRVCLVPRRAPEDALCDLEPLLAANAAVLSLVAHDLGSRTQAPPTRSQTLVQSLHSMIVAELRKSAVSQRSQRSGLAQRGSRGSSSRPATSGAP